MQYMNRGEMVLAVMLTALSVASAQACNVPVYRYAMYNWASAPYLVFYFHHGQVAEEDQPVNRLLAELIDTEPAPNLIFKAVDATQDEQVEQLPQLVREAWQSHSQGTEPLHLVFTPWGAQLFAGRLDVAAVRSMVDSPARKWLGELLAQGNAAVLLILTGPDAAENRRAEDVAAGVIAQVADGDFAGPSNFLPEPTEGAAADSDPQGLPAARFEVASLKLSRTDPAEKWLVKMLLSVESDLHEFPKEPMIFAVYGRGRAMPPYVGKGITPENLAECVAFLSGACSCMVKEQNPGMDLLFHWDWGAVADAMAAEEEDTGGGLFGYQEFMPDQSGNWTETPLPEDDTEDTAKEPTTAVKETPATPKSPAKVNRSPSTYESFAARQAWKIGVGLAAAAILVLAAGFVLVRRRQP